MAECENDGGGQIIMATGCGAEGEGERGQLRWQSCPLWLEPLKWLRPPGEAAVQVQKGKVHKAEES